MTNKERIKIYSETILSIKNLGYQIPGNNEKIPLKGAQGVKENSKIYTEIEHDTKGISKKLKYTTKIKVENIDCLKKAKEFGENCVVLNMASWIKPGGGVLGGSSAQEENLFRRTNLGISLYQFHPDYQDIYKLPKDRISEWKYPIITDTTGIYSPGITVFRDTEENEYRYLREPYKISVISVPGLNKPRCRKSGSGEIILNWGDRNKTKERIRTILRISTLNNHTKLVLGALGCGAYGNPSIDVARCFNEVLQENSFKGVFEEICFAVLDDYNSVRPDNPRGNYKPFKEMLENEKLV